MSLLRLNRARVVEPLRACVSPRGFSRAAFLVVTVAGLAAAPEALARPAFAQADPADVRPAAPTGTDSSRSTVGLVAPPATESDSSRANEGASESTSTASGSTSAGRGDRSLSTYLQRRVRSGPHFIDHGVLQVDVAGGWPHLYRLGLALGVLDHLSLGVTAHWLPRQSRPAISPVVAVAFYRNRLLAVGARHFWSMHPPPVTDFDPQTPSYQRTAQWTLGTASFGQRWITAGFDAGVVRARIDDPSLDPDTDGNVPPVSIWRFGGGLHMRVGTRRWGFSAQVLVPQAFAELRLDVRFGLFERRSRGGWKPTGVVEDWDRSAVW